MDKPLFLLLVPRKKKPFYVYLHGFLLGLRKKGGCKIMNTFNLKQTRPCTHGSRGQDSLSGNGTSSVLKERTTRPHYISRSIQTFVSSVPELATGPRKNLVSSSAGQNRTERKKHEIRGNEPADHLKVKKRITGSGGWIRMAEDRDLCLCGAV